MAQQLMWSQIESLYRGQGTNGTVVTVELDAMDLAQKRAGKSVFDTDWWVETLKQVLDHWGIYSQRWTDAATRMPRVHFSITQPRPGQIIDGTQQPTTQQQPYDSGPINTGTL